MPIKRGVTKKKTTVLKKPAASRTVLRAAKTTKKTVARKVAIKRVASVKRVALTRKPAKVAVAKKLGRGQKALAIVSGVLILISSVMAPFWVMAAWQNPGGNPPSGNAADPVNTANTAQSKQGTMWISSGNAYQGNPYTYGLIVQNGRVGIGSTTPGVLMAVDAGAGVTAINVGGGRISNLSEIPISWSEAASRYYVDYRVSQATSTYTYWRPNGTHIYSSNTGNVGIGSNNPGYKLHVVGNAYFTTNIGIGTTPSTSYGVRSRIGLTNTSGQNSVNAEAFPVTNANGTYYNMAGVFRGSENASAGATNSGYVMGIDMAGYLNGAGNLNTAYGARIDTGTNTGGTGTVTNSYGTYIRLLNQGSGTMTNAYGVYISSNRYSGTIGSAYGVYIGDMDATSGYGVYQTASGDINYFAGNVGIGTNSPTLGKLQVNGSDYIMMAYNPSSANGQTARIAASTGSAQGQIEIDYFNDASGGYGMLQVGKSSYTQQMRYMASNHYFNNNVGIATTSPGTLLAIDGASGGNRVYLGDGRIVGLTEVPIANNEAASRYYVDFRTGGAGGIPTPGTNGNTMRSNGTDWIATNNLYNNGTFIGIGTTTVNGVLSTDGNVRVSGTLSVTDMIEDATDSRLDVNDDLYVAGGNIQTNSGNDYAKYCMWGAGDTTYCMGMYSAHTFGYLNDYALTFGMSNTANRGWLWRDTSDAASDGAMSLTTDGRLAVKSTSWFQGSVGIGSSTPGTALSVDGAGSANRVYLGDGRIVGVTEVPISNNEASSKYYVDYRTGGAGGIPAPSTAGNTMYSNGTNWVASQNLYNAGGNIGIGTNNPSYTKVHTSLGNFTNANTATAGYYLYGNATTNAGHAGLRISLDNSTANYAGFVRAARTSGTTYIGMEIGSETNHGIRFLTNGAADANERMRIDNSGNVGIGTAVPGVRLHVYGSGELLRMMDSSATGNPYISFYQTGTRRSYIQHVDTSDELRVNSEYGEIAFWTGSPNAERMVISSTGNVGISTTTPGAALSVDGGGSATRAYFGDGRISGLTEVPISPNEAASKYYVDFATGGGVPAPAGLSGYTLRSNGTNWVAMNNLYNDGTNIGIGTTNPGSYRL
jgi:hypothetical protein